MLKNFKKNDLVNSLSNETGLSHNFSKNLLNDLLEIILHNIKSGDFNLKDIGSFKILPKNIRYGRNPKTKQQFVITSRKSISFKASKKLINKINE